MKPVGAAPRSREGVFGRDDVQTSGTVQARNALRDHDVSPDPDDLLARFCYISVLVKSTDSPQGFSCGDPVVMPRARMHVLHERSVPAVSADRLGHLLGPATT